MPHVKLEWLDKLTFVAGDADGHAIVLDTTADQGGDGSGVKPIELLLMSLGACMAMDVVSILKKKRADLRSFRVELEGDRSSTDPKRYTEIRVKLRANKEVKQVDIQRSFELSRDKYCSVLGTLRNAPSIVYDVGVEE